MKYNETSDNEPSEIQITSTQQINYMPSIDFTVVVIHFNHL